MDGGLWGGCGVLEKDGRVTDGSHFLGGAVSGGGFDGIWIIASWIVIGDEQEVRGWWWLFWVGREI